MVVRKRRRVNKLLGQRTRGNGDTKNRRGAGSRGGRGLAGSHKHKYTKYHGKFGQEKKKVLSTKIVRALNIDQLMQIMPKLLASKKVTAENGLLVVDGEKISIDKLLSNGALTEKILVRNMKASKKAIEKIEKAEGIFEVSEEDNAEEEANEEKEFSGEEEEESGEEIEKEFSGEEEEESGEEMEEESSEEKTE